VIDEFEIALNGKQKRRVRGKILDREQEAKVIALRLGQPPKGFGNWSLRLLAEQAVALEIVESIRYETLRRTQKKRHHEAEDRLLGHPTGSRRRVRREHVGGVGTSRSPLRSLVSGDLRERTADSVAQGNASADPPHQKACPSSRLRVLTSEDSEHLHVL
jgi:hypothetical protein